MTNYTLRLFVWGVCIETCLRVRAPGVGRRELLLGPGGGEKVLFRYPYSRSHVGNRHYFEYGVEIGLIGLLSLESN